MFATVIYFLPCIVSLIWLVLFISRKRNATQQILTWLLLAAAIHYASTAIFISPATTFEWVCRWDIICQPLILCTIALCVIYMRTHLDGYVMKLSHIQWFFIPAIIQATIVWLLYYMIGFDNVVKFSKAAAEVNSHLGNSEGMFQAMPQEFNTQLYRLYYIFDVFVSNIWSAILAICLLWSCLEVSRKHGYKFGAGLKFWFGGAPTTPERAVSYWMLFIIVSEIPFLLFGRKYIYQHPALGLSMTLLASLALFCMCYSEYFSQISHFTIHSLTHRETHLSLDTERATKLAEEEHHNTKTDTKPQQIVSETRVVSQRMEEKNNSIATELKHLLEEEKIFTDKDLTLEILAKRMNTNRNKLSTIVNQIYGIDFRNVLAKLRIEEAKRFIKANPFETMETVAMHCGFKDTSSFFHRFKDIVGESPRMWIANKENTLER